MLLSIRFRESVKIVHFIGAQKPWYYTYNADNGSVMGPAGLYESEYLVNWWSVFYNNVYPKIGDEIVKRKFFLFH